jgi:hypothetical protein
MEFIVPRWRGPDVRSKTKIERGWTKNEPKHDFLEDWIGKKINSVSKSTPK